MTVVTRRIVQGKIAETDVSDCMDIMFKTDTGNLTIRLNKEGEVQLHSEGRLHIRPESSNTVVIIPSRF